MSGSNNMTGTNGTERLVKQFDWPDYLVLASMLISSAGIGGNYFIAN